MRPPIGLLWEVELLREGVAFRPGAGELRTPERLLSEGWARLPFRPALRFIWMYFLKRGFLDGRPGLILCTLMTMHEAVISAKMYEEGLKTED